MLHRLLHEQHSWLVWQLNRGKYNRWLMVVFGWLPLEVSSICRDLGQSWYWPDCSTHTSVKKFQNVGSDAVFGEYLVSILTQERPEPLAWYSL